MGLLDSLLSGSQGGYGGLLNSLLYPSPLNQPQQTPQSQYDPMGNFTGMQTGGAPDPFGPPPGQAEWAKQFAPPSPFTGSAPATPVQFAGSAPTQPAPQMPPQAPPMPQPTVPQGPIDNMPVGNNYQMPQFGSAADYTPAPQAAQASPTDVSAQSRAPQQPLPPALGGANFGGNFGASLQSFANTPGGIINKLAGGTSALLTGQRTDPTGIQQQNLKAQFDALVDAGLPRNLAMASVLNPKVLEQVGPGYFSKNEIVDGGTDPLTGKKTFVLKNSVDGTVTELNSRGGTSGGSNSGSGQDVADSIAQAKAKGATRDQLLQLVPSSYRPYVDAVLQDKALPANMGRGAARMQVMGLAHAVDSNFNEEMIPTRVAMRKDFAGEGKNGQAIGALNTVQHHADQVSDAIEGYQKAGGGSDYPFINAGKLMLANNTSFDPKLRDSAQQLKDKLNATEHEVASAYNAGHLSDHDLKTWNEIKAENLPIGQLKQKLADFVDLLNGKRDSLNHMYRNTFGEDAPAIDKAANESTTAKIHQRMPQYGSGGSKAPVVYQNGHPYILQPDGSYK